MFLTVYQFINIYYFELENGAKMTPNETSFVLIRVIFYLFLNKKTFKRKVVKISSWCVVLLFVICVFLVFFYRRLVE